MKELDEARQRNLLRYAMRQLELPPPPSTRLSQIVDELMHARRDAQPLVSWQGAEVRRYRGHIYLLAASLASGREDGRRLTPENKLDLGPGMGCLSLTGTDGPCIDSDVATAGLTIRFRDGGESIRPVGHDHSQKLKKLLQEAAVVPWMRDCIPLLYSGDDLVAVADLWTAAEFSKPRGYRVCWHGRPEIH
jgi:tRNA(Ile)-lysidine synthase